MSIARRRVCPPRSLCYSNGTVLLRARSGQFRVKSAPAENVSASAPLRSGMGSAAVPVADWNAEPLVRPETARSKVLTFDEVYEKYFDEVSRWMRALGGPEAERDDLVQDVFFIVYRRLPDFDGDNLPGWLYQIARRRVRDFRRLVWFRHSFGSSQVDDSLPSNAIDPEAIAGNNEMAGILNRLLTTLPDNQRAALVLFEVEGYSGEDIARLQGVPINTVRARIFKARKKLLAQVARLPQQR